MAVAITQTANPAAVTGSGQVATYDGGGSGISIGTASSDRIVVLVVGSEQTSGTSIDSATYDQGGGDTAMTAGTLGHLSGGIVSARAFWALIPTGTTVNNFKITCNSPALWSTTNHQIAVYSVTGARTSTVAISGANSSTDMDATAPLTTGPISIPTNGGAIFVAVGSTDTVAKTWAGATEDLDNDAGGCRFCTATSTTAGVAIVTCTGGTNAEDGALSFLVFAPASPTFGTFLGGTGTSVLSITNPFTPVHSVGVEVGDLLIVNVSEINALSSTTCADNLGNSFTALTSGTTSSSNDKAYYSLVTAAGQSIPSVTTTASANDATIEVAVYAGPFTASPLDINPAVAGDSAEPYSATATGTLAQADELIVGYFGSGPAETYDTPSPGSTDISVTGSTSSGAITSLVVSATTTQTMTISGTNGTRPTVCGVATFKKQVAAAFIAPEAFIINQAVMRGANW